MRTKTLHKQPKDRRKPLMVGADMTNLPVDEWTDEQRRLGGAWAKHEIQHRTDELCCPYDWQPGWTELTADQIYNGLMKYYEHN